MFKCIFNPKSDLPTVIEDQSSLDNDQNLTETSKNMLFENSTKKDTSQEKLETIMEINDLVDDDDNDKMEIQQLNDDNTLLL
jgi:hypothetical protein